MKASQLRFASLTTDPSLQGERYVLTRPLRTHPRRAEVEARVSYCLAFFPELDGRPFGLGLTRQALGLASLEEFSIWLNPRNLSLHTVAHELTHLLQARGLVPGGERACDLFALSRDSSLNDSRPNYLDLPDDIFDDRRRPMRGWSRVLRELAVEALGHRARGQRAYIRWFEDEIARLSVSPAIGEPAGS